MYYSFLKRFSQEIFPKFPCAQCAFRHTAHTAHYACICRATRDCELRFFITAKPASPIRTVGRSLSKITRAVPPYAIRAFLWFVLLVFSIFISHFPFFPTKNSCAGVISAFSTDQTGASPGISAFCCQHPAFSRIIALYPLRIKLLFHLSSLRAGLFVCVRRFWKAPVKSAQSRVFICASLVNHKD